MFRPTPERCTLQKHAAPDPSKQPEQTPKRGRRRGLVALCIVAGALVVAYAIGFAFFSTHFVPGTTVNGTDVSAMDQATLEQLVNQGIAGWEERVQGPNGFSLALKASDVSLKANASTYARGAMDKNHPERWPLGLFEKTQVHVTEATSYDEAALKAAVAAAVEAYNASATQPTNAGIEYSSDQKAFVATDEAVGTALDADAVEKAVASGVASLSTDVTLDDSVLAQPSLGKDDATLQETLKRANQMLALRIPLSLDGKTLATVGSDQLSGWVSVSNGTQIDVSRDAIASWVSDQLADQVASSDEEHDWALDGDSLAGSIFDAVCNASSDAIEIPRTLVGTRPAESEGAREQGRHIDVNLTTQYARFYDSDGTVIWRSYFVSGDTSEGRATPTGTFSINNKMTDQTLIGADEDKDGEPDYRSKVSYWMPFLGNSVGLHDAPWRSSFGGTIYQWNGSHGCINLPSQSAAELFSLVKVGDKVIVHT